jgi:hypothetical protein
MIFQTAQNAELQIEEMLESIADFHAKEEKWSPTRRNSMHRASTTQRVGGRRRQQILGDMHDSEVVATRVDVVLKSDACKYLIMSVLKRHFLFSQLHDYELDDVIDSMQNHYSEEGQKIIEQGQHGDKFYIMEEGKIR